MSEKQSSEDNIIEELKKTGYPTEIVTGSILDQRQWEVMHNPSYLDDTEGRNREFDIRGYRWRPISTLETGTQFFVNVNLIVECKKSEKPWVFFTTPADANPRSAQQAIMTRGRLKNILKGKYHGTQAIIPLEEIVKHHHYFQQARWARTFYEPFKNQERSDRSQMIYSAVTSATKAVLFFLKDTPETDSALIFYPLIVFNGDMYAAEVGANKEIRLSSSQHVQLSFNYIEPSLKSIQGSNRSYQFLIDIVREDYLDQYLSIIEAEHDWLLSTLQELVSSGQLSMHTLA